MSTLFAQLIGGLQLFKVDLKHSFFQVILKLTQLNSLNTVFSNKCLFYVKKQLSSWPELLRFSERPSTTWVDTDHSNVQTSSAGQRTSRNPKGQTVQVVTSNQWSSWVKPSPFPCHLTKLTSGQSSFGLLLGSDNWSTFY